MKEMQAIPSLFPDEEFSVAEANAPIKARRKRVEVFNDYEGFVEKFKPKKTTDDCYTPPHIYEAVLDWVKDKIPSVRVSRIVRPFYPGGDYKAYDYQHGDVVVDNPPFSILSEIRRFYASRGIPYFMFAPHLTLFSSFDEFEKVTFIVANYIVTYENGATVNTGFVTNMWLDDDIVVVAGDLNTYLREADAVNKKKTETPKLPLYEYPPEVISSASLGRIAARGINLRFPRAETYRIRKLDSQIAYKKAIFGNGFLISERLAAERLAAERLAAERLAAERLVQKEKYYWELSENEIEIVKRLSSKQPN